MFLNKNNKKTSFGLIDLVKALRIDKG